MDILSFRLENVWLPRSSAILSNASLLKSYNAMKPSANLQRFAALPFPSAEAEVNSNG